MSEELSDHQKKIVREMREDGAYIYEAEYGDKFYLMNPSIDYGERGIRPSTVRALIRKNKIEVKGFYKGYDDYGTRKLVLKHLTPTP